MIYLDINNPEWHQMWDALASYKLNSGDHLCINQGQCWEYMGSTRDHHHFRHNCHPYTERVEYIYIERAGAALKWA